METATAGAVSARAAQPFGAGARWLSRAARERCDRANALGRLARSWFPNCVQAVNWGTWDELVLHYLER